VRRPKITPPLPGPRARAAIARSDRWISTSYTRDYPLVADHAEGSWLTDPDGNEFLDMTAGVAVNATGHCHPHVVAAIQAQAAKLVHMSGTDFYYEVQTTLAERLAALKGVRGPDARVYFCNSGTEAVEAAIKLARYKTGRQAIIPFLGSFHGRTLGALSATASKVVHRRGFAPLLPGFFHATYPDPLRHGADATARALDHLDRMLSRLVPPDEVAAILVEPLQGEGGYVVPPDDFLAELRRRCDHHGMLLVYDEVQSGMGRTGRMFGWHHSGIEPDLLCLAKGIASGMPLGALLARSAVMDWPPGAHASTFGGNPVSCAAAHATLDLLEQGLVANAARVGERLVDLLSAAAGSHPRVAEIRGRGLMLAVDIVADRKSLTADPITRAQLVHAAFERGLLLLGCGPSAVRFSPALSVTEEEAQVAVEIFADVLATT
jgi:4-aminobutyrate aminotransferase